MSPPWDAITEAIENLWYPPCTDCFHYPLSHCTLFHHFIALKPNRSSRSVTYTSTQNDSRRASTQDFYQTTVDALNAEDAANAETAHRLKEAREAAKKGAKLEAVGPNKPKEHQAQTPIDIEIPKPEDGRTRAEKPVSGRKKMKGGEKWDMATGKEAAIQAHGQEEHARQEEQETQEQHEIEVELNAILKKGPSKLEPASVFADLKEFTCVTISDEADDSHHLFQIILPLFCQSQAYFTR